MQQQAPGGRPQLINMCVPIELLPPILDDLSRGRPTHEARPWLGVFCHDSEDGVTVMDVAADGPAARAELRQGDAILAVAGLGVSDLADFYTALWALGPAGVTAPLTVRRENDVFDLEVPHRRPRRETAEAPAELIAFGGSASPPTSLQRTAGRRGRRPSRT